MIPPWTCVIKEVSTFAKKSFYLVLHYPSPHQFTIDLSLSEVIIEGSGVTKIKHKKPLNHN